MLQSQLISDFLQVKNIPIVEERGCGQQPRLSVLTLTLTGNLIYSNSMNFERSISILIVLCSHQSLQTKQIPLFCARYRSLHVLQFLKCCNRFSNIGTRNLSKELNKYPQNEGLELLLLPPWESLLELELFNLQWNQCARLSSVSSSPRMAHLSNCKYRDSINLVSLQINNMRKNHYGFVSTGN